MKKTFITAVLFFMTTATFSQSIKKNGTVFIKHPYIKTVEKAMQAYLKKDDAANLKIYADTAKYWYSAMNNEKPMGIKEAIKMWDTDFDYYDSIKLKPVGYPDYLEYVQGNVKIVQSWWEWSGISKKTGETLIINFVQFDWFNKAGKITFEAIYGDFSKMVKE
ncbi:hypothetical protein ACQ33O_02605 [Ferruginibacter sp. SUN002]|uniref:hypothetical protein n=1 Tax=Ferruginibacter sp. SUN002 TaxID=2937789 RepID=UPI003D36DBAF